MSWFRPRGTIAGVVSCFDSRWVRTSHMKVPRCIAWFWDLKNNVIEIIWEYSAGMYEEMIKQLFPEAVDDVHTGSLFMGSLFQEQ